MAQAVPSGISFPSDGALGVDERAGSFRDPGSGQQHDPLLLRAGKNDEQQGLGIFSGEKGLAFYRQMLQQGIMPGDDNFDIVDHYTELSFKPSQQLDRVNQYTIQNLGWSVEQREVWPVFGYRIIFCSLFPLRDEKVLFMQTIMEQSMQIARATHDHARPPGVKNLGEMLIRKRIKAAQGWVWRSIRRKVRPSAPKKTYKLKVGPELLKEFYSVRKWKSNSWQVKLIRFSEPVNQLPELFQQLEAQHQWPPCLWNMVMIRSSAPIQQVASPYIVSWFIDTSCRPDEILITSARKHAREIQEMLLRLIILHQQLPEFILVDTVKAKAILTPLTKEIGIRLFKIERLLPFIPEMCEPIPDEHWE